MDYIHLSAAIPPKLSISSFMGYLKGKSTLMIYDRYPEWQSKWDKTFWARGYDVSTIGNIKLDTICKSGLRCGKRSPDFYYEILRYHFKLKIVGKCLLRFLMIISSDQDVLWETVPFFHNWLKIAY